MALKVPCPHCKKRLSVNEELAGKRIKCPGCGQTFTVSQPATQSPELAAPTAKGNKRADEAAPRRGDAPPSLHPIKGMKYFEVPRPSGDGVCSDEKCPCNNEPIPRGTGYLYVNLEMVKFRRDCLTVEEFTAKKRRVAAKLGSSRAFDPRAMKAVVMPRSLIPILMCRQGAKQRESTEGMSLEAAAADAAYWWETGLVPLRHNTAEATLMVKLVGSVFVLILLGVVGAGGWWLFATIGWWALLVILGVLLGLVGALVWAIRANSGPQAEAPATKE